MVLVAALAGCQPEPIQTTVVVTNDAPTTSPSDSPSDPTEAPGDTPGGPLPSIVEPIVSVPVYGGTVEAVDGVGWVAADPPGDRLLVVRDATISSLDLGSNARPFRILVEDGVARVTLRGTGELVSVDVAAEPPAILWRSEVCAEPRGVARSPAGPLVVACAEGQLVEVADDGHVIRSVQLIEDLRDVVPVGDLLYVSRFASAEVVGASATTLSLVFRVKPEPMANVAWRMRADEQQGGTVLLHQTRGDVVVPNPTPDVPTPYYSITFPTACGAIVESTLSFFPDDLVVGEDGVAAPVPSPGATLGDAVLATDFDVAPDGTVAVAAAGGGLGFPPFPDYVRYVSIGLLRDHGACRGGTTFSHTGDEPNRIAAVAYDGGGTLLVQGVGPTQLAKVESGSLSGEVLLSEHTQESSGFPLFHQAPSAPVACASCHPEGGDDGTVWVFLAGGTAGLPFELVRKTIPLAGDLSHRAPFHWSADLADDDALMEDTFTLRMNGGDVSPEETDELFDWLDGLRPVRARSANVLPIQEAGYAAFTKAGCDACHSGPTYTNNRLEVVRAGVEPIKTPSLLGLAARNPLLHDGCAATLEERFLPPCDDGTDLHGELSLLDDVEMDALLAFLRTL